MDSIWILHIAQAAPQGGGGAGMFVPMILMFAVFYFMMIRPQQKKQKLHQEWLNSLKRGDDVVTTGGLVGKITQLGTDGTLTLEVGDKENRVRLRVLRSAVSGKPPEVSEPAKDAAKPAAPEKTT